MIKELLVKWAKKILFKFYYEDISYHEIYKFYADMNRLENAVKIRKNQIGRYWLERGMTDNEDRRKELKGIIDFLEGEVLKMEGGKDKVGRKVASASEVLADWNNVKNTEKLKFINFDNANKVLKSLIGKFNK